MEPLPTARSMPKRTRSGSVKRKTRSRSTQTRRRKFRRKKPLALQRHSFVERKTTDLVMNVDNESSAVGMFKSFNLNEMNNAAQYKELFEYYRIDKVVVTFKYKAYSYANAVSALTGVNEVNPILFFKKDHNDVSADSITVMKESMKTKEVQLTNNRPNFSIVLKPAVQAEAYHSPVSSTYVPKWGQWLSTDDGSVPHYGLKAYAIGFKSGSIDPGQIQVSFKYYVSFKNNE